MTASRPVPPAPGGRLHDERSFELLRHAAVALADHASRGAVWPAGALVIVTGPGPLGRGCLRDVHRSCGSAAGSPVWEGDELGGEIAAAAGPRLQRLRDRLVAGPLLAVAGLEGLGSALAQRRFAGIIDAAAAAGTGVCLTTSRHPATGGFSPRLATRLCAGLVVRLAEPDAAIPAAGRHPGRGPALAAVVRATARHLGVPAARLVGPDRQRSVAQARSLAMYLSRRLTGRSLGDIGKALGGRDHSTVIHGIRTAIARLGEDAGFAADAERIAVHLLGRPRREPAVPDRRSG